jgi:hypothetical protein
MTKENDSKMPRSWQVCTKHLSDIERRIENWNDIDINTQIQYAILWELSRIADTLQLHIDKNLGKIALRERI